MAFDAAFDSAEFADPDAKYAKPRPLTRNSYLVRSNKALSFLMTADTLLRICLPKHRSLQPPAKPKRILVSNWAHIGDVITSLPSIRALRESFPSAKIDLIVGRWSRFVVEGSDLYDKLYTVDHFILNRSSQSLSSKIRTYLDDRARFIEAARGENYDAGIDFYPYFPPTSPLFRQAGIPVRCAFTSGGFGPLLTHPVEWSYRGRPMTQFGRDLITTLWPDLGQSIGRLSLSPEDLRTKPADRFIPLGTRYVVVHIGTGTVWREWPEARWVDLLRAWGDDAPRLVICGTGPEEEALARRVAAQLSAGRAVLFIDRKWEDFVDLVAVADGLICLESSAAHVAAAFSVPTVAIYSGTNELPLWGPDQPNARIVVAPTGCAPCHRAGCEAMACVRGISAGDVLTAVRSQLNGHIKNIHCTGRRANGTGCSS
jgi:ADP-heptose:LPS heptosyltransferase